MRIKTHVYFEPGTNGSPATLSIKEGVREFIEDALLRARSFEYNSKDLYPISYLTFFCDQWSLIKRQNKTSVRIGTDDYVACIYCRCPMISKYEFAFVCPDCGSEYNF